MWLYRLRIALRVMIRERFFSILNVVGLAVGSCSVIMIFLYVSDELSYDTFHQNGSSIYRVNMTNIWIQGNDVFGSTGPGVAGAIREKVPGVKEVVRLHYPWLGGTQLVSVSENNGEQKAFEEWNILAIDPNFFDVFSVSPLAGEFQDSFDEPNTVILTKNTAIRYFGTEDVVGRQLSIGQRENKRTVQVRGVVEDYPDQSHFDFNILITMNSFPNIKRRENTWWWTTFVTYVLIDEQTDIGQIKSQLAELPAAYNSAEDVERLNWELFLQSFGDIYLNSRNIPNRLGPQGSRQNVMAFSLVALLILFLSCVNFMNLSTARYSNRVKEIGIQKVLGSSNGQIRIQFLTEALIYSTIAVILGLGMVELFKGGFNNIAEKSLEINVFKDPLIILMVIGLILFTGFIAGTYPAWFLTRFKVVEVLKGKLKISGNLSFRNILVIFQFAISIALISMAFIVRDQLKFITQKDLGFDEEHVLTVNRLEWLGTSTDAFVNSLENSPYFQQVSKSKAVPPYTWNQDIIQPINSEVEELSVTQLHADPSFSSVLGLELVAGRYFFESGEGDKSSVIINESSAVSMGFMNPDEDPTEVIGKRIRTQNEDFQVIGVLKDFNFWSVQMDVEPMALFSLDAPMWQPERTYLITRMTQKDQDGYENTLKFLEEEWNKHSGGLPFSYMFMNDEFDEAFRNEMKLGKIIDIATVLALFIAVLGLVGLISYTTEQRTKEFGIRKVLGASLTQLIGLLTRDFVRLLLVSLLFGVGISYLVSVEWLKDFNDAVSISPLNFIIAATIILALILVINGAIVSRNARKNPATTLRDE